MRTWATLKLRPPLPALSQAGLQPVGGKRLTHDSLQPEKEKPSVYHEYQGPSSLLWSGLAPTSLGFWSCPVGQGLSSPVISCLTAVTSDVLRTCEAEGTRGLSVWGVGESFILFASGGSSRVCEIVTTAVQVGGWRREHRDCDWSQQHRW